MAQKEVAKMSMADIKTELETQATAYNSALVKEKYEALPGITKRMDELVSEYAKKAKSEFLNALNGKENPLTLAIKSPNYTVLAYRDTADKKSGAVTREVTNKTRTITFADLNSKFASSFKYKNWKAYVEQLNLRMCLWTAKELDVPAAELKKIESEFAMKNGGADVDLGATPTSNTQLLKQLRAVCEGIYGEGDIKSEIKSHDVNYLQMCYTKMGKELRHVSTLNSSKLANVILVIMNRILTGTGYEVDYKVNQNKNSAETVQETKKTTKVKSAKKSAKAKKPAKQESESESVRIIERASQDAPATESAA